MNNDAAAFCPCLDCLVVVLFPCFLCLHLRHDSQNTASNYEPGLNWCHTSTMKQAAGGHRDSQGLMLMRRLSSCAHLTLLRVSKCCIRLHDDQGPESDARHLSSGERRKHNKASHHAVMGGRREGSSSQHLLYKDSLHEQRQSLGESLELCYLQANSRETSL